jgi:hypothetical protein
MKKTIRKNTVKRFATLLSFVLCLSCQAVFAADSKTSTDSESQIGDLIHTSVYGSTYSAPNDLGGCGCTLGRIILRTDSSYNLTNVNEVSNRYNNSLINFEDLLTAK